MQGEIQKIPFERSDGPFGFIYDLHESVQKLIKADDGKCAQGWIHPEANPESRNFVSYHPGLPGGYTITGMTMIENEKAIKLLRKSVKSGDAAATNEF